MDFKRRYRKALAFFLSLVLMLPAVSVYADNGRASSEKGALPEEASVSSMLKEEVSALQSLTPGKDYVDGEGVFLADSLSEAKKTASEYDAELISYDYGVASVRFKGSTAEALDKAAALSTVSTLIEPDYTAELLDVDDNFAKILEESGSYGKSSFEEGHVNSGDTEGSDPLADKQYYHKLIKDGDARKISSGNGVTVAVLDTGVNTEHEDLNTGDKKSAGYIEKLWIPALASVNDAGEVDKEHSGFDYNMGHGTHVNGIIAAIKGNGKGGYGIAPGVRIDSIQVTRERSFSLKNIAIGVRMAIDRHVDIITMSMGSNSNASYLSTVIDEAYDNGIICVAAAGNSGSEKEYYPAAYEHCISVGAVTATEGKLADFSNYGSWVDILSPGSGIWSSYIYQKYDNSSGSIKQGSSNIDSYRSVGGTSQATPMVAAVTAMCLGSNPDLMKEKSGERFDIIKEILEITSDGKTYSYSDRTLYGMIQAYDAVNLTKSFKLHPSHTLVDAAGHYGSLFSGFISEKKSFKLKIGDSEGKISDKKLTKSVSWNSSNPEAVKVEKGKVKCVSGKEGDRVLITATVGSDTLIYFLKVQRTVKKMGVLRGDMRIVGKCDKSVRTGQAVKIANPFSAVSDNEIGVYYTKKKKQLSAGIDNCRDLADGRFKYDISVSKRDLKKVSVEKTDSNGDPLVIIPKKSGSVITVKYKLLDGSNKKFTVKLRVA